MKQIDEDIPDYFDFRTLFQTKTADDTNNDLNRDFKLYDSNWTTMAKANWLK